MKKLLPLLLLSLSVQAVGAEEREWIPYQKLVEVTYLDKYYGAPAAARDKVTIVGALTPKNPHIQPGDVVLTVVYAGGRQTIPVGVDGRMALVYKPQWVAQNAMVLINQPKGEKMAIGADLHAVIPDGLQWPYATLMGSVPQSNGLIKSYAGALSMFLPKMKGVKLKFAHAAQLRIETKSGTLALATDAKNIVQLKLDDDLMRDNPLMVVSERPLEAELID